MKKQKDQQDASVAEFLRDMYTFGFSSIKEALDEARNPYERVADDGKAPGRSVKDSREGGGQPAGSQRP